MARHTAATGLPLRLWERIAQPRVKRIVFLIIYAFHTVAGIGVLLSLPTAFTDVLGEWPTVIWGGLLVAGGVFGAVAVLPGWNFVERLALLACFSGIAMASLLLLAQPANGATLTLWALVTGWLAVFAERSWDIRLYSIAPTT